LSQSAQDEFANTLWAQVVSSDLNNAWLFSSRRRKYRPKSKSWVKTVRLRSKANFMISVSGAEGEPTLDQ